METLRGISVRDRVTRSLSTVRTRETTGSENDRMYYDSIGRQARNFTTRAAVTWRDRHWVMANEEPASFDSYSSTPEPISAEATDNQRHHIAKLNPRDIEHMSQDTMHAKIGAELARSMGGLFLGKKLEDIENSQQKEIARIITRTFAEPLSTMESVTKPVSSRRTVLAGRDLTETSFGHVVTARRTFIDMDIESPDKDNRPVTTTSYWLLPSEEQDPIQSSYKRKPLFGLWGVKGDSEYLVKMTYTTESTEVRQFPI